MSQRPRTEARWRGDSRQRSLLLCGQPPALPERSQRGSDTVGRNSGSPEAGGFRGQGPGAARVGEQGLATTFDSRQRVGPFHLWPQTDQGPQGSGLSGPRRHFRFLLSLYGQKTFVSLQPRRLPGFFPPLRSADLLQLQTQGHCS